MVNIFENTWYGRYKNAKNILEIMTSSSGTWRLLGPDVVTNFKMSFIPLKSRALEMGPSGSTLRTSVKTCDRQSAEDWRVDVIFGFSANGS